MSLFRNEPRREHGSRFSAADMAAMGEARNTQPMTDEAADATQTHARRGLRDTEVVDAVVVDPEPRDERAQTPAADSTPSRTAVLGVELAKDFRTRWDATQIGFVDDPRQAVRQADELVAEVIESLAQTLTDERKQLATKMSDTASTENLRVALQSYRSYFRRLLLI